MRIRATKWIRRHPFASTAVGGVLLAVWPMLCLAVIQNAHTAIRASRQTGGIPATVIGMQYDWIHRYLSLPLQICFVLGVAIAITSVMLAIMPKCTKERRRAE